MRQVQVQELDVIGCITMQTTTPLKILILLFLLTPALQTLLLTLLLVQVQLQDRQAVMEQAMLLTITQ